MKYNLMLTHKELLVLAGVFHDTNMNTIEWQKVRDRRLRKIARYEWEAQHNLWLKIIKLTDK